jgi:threonine dehydratase
MSVKLSDIQAAQKILQGIALRTPVVKDKKLSKDLGAPVYLKAECLQQSGSFKVRGAYNKISQLPDAEKRRGVVAPSAGNHAQGVALAAQLHGIKATIVMPVHAPLTKITATRSYGADVKLVGQTFDEAAAYARMLAETEGFTPVHAFDDELVIAGQGTIGIEIVEDLPAVSVIVIPIGGGGIISGVAVAAKNLLPSVRIVGVQAAECAPVQKSIEAGKICAVETAMTIADGIAVKRPGALTLPIITEFVDEIVTVTEDEIAAGIFHSVQHAKLVAEGAGAAGVAALVAGKINVEKNDTVCAVICGGNIDPNLLSRVLEQVMARQGRYILLKLMVVDRPGALAGLTAEVARTGANVIDLFHRRAMWLAPLGKVGVELVLEVRDNAHAREVESHLESVGYHVVRETQGDWDK